MIDLFTEKELQSCRAMLDKGLNTEAIRKALVEPVMPRINRDSAQENDAQYMAYRLVYFASGLAPYPTSED